MSERRIKQKEGQKLSKNNFDLVWSGYSAKPKYIDFKKIRRYVRVWNETGFSKKSKYVVSYVKKTVRSIL